MEVIERVKAMSEEYLRQNNIELFDIIYRREQGGMVLRLLVDTPDGISVNECEALNNYLSNVLDEEGFIGEPYTLEVSSPGLDRPIKTDRDFERVMGKELDVTVYEPIDGKRAHSGRLIGMDKEKIVLESGGISVVIGRGKVASAKLKIEF